mgnify:CR=1 FL=1
MFIIGLENNIFPNKNRLLGNSELEEERRICYVAITRAKNKVFMTHCHERLLYGTYFHNQVSDFIKESIGYDDRKETLKVEAIKEIPKIASNTKQNILLPTSGDCDYNVGDTVMHDKFGEGMIISMKNGIGNIFFTKDKTSKNIVLNHPALRKK